ncbi:hypothetical protein GF326_00480 [Candidatus Bathyarchaeota archaeon]|nr:hypothetical protein [Candidatus Bathyarchaeota archaeon]
MSQNRNTLLGIVIILLIVGIGLFYPRNQPTQEESTIKITSSFYPLTYLTEYIGGEKVEVTTLIPYNNDVHSWQPSISDITATEDSDIIIYLGAGLDHWMDEDILETINLEEKEIVEASHGIELASGDHTEEDEAEHDHDEGDPHLWISPYKAKMIAEKIYQAINTVDPDNSDYYQSNWEQLESKLTNLDQRYQTELEPAMGKTFFVTHSAYGYLAKRYGLEQHGVIGLTADEQPSTNKIAEIVDMMIEEESYVFYIDPVYSSDYAETLKDELSTRTGKNVEILNLYLANGPVDDLDYLEQLEANLENLKQGLVN